MLILLPPSETKRAGGARRPIDVSSLALASLAPQRESVIEALVSLSEDPAEAARVLKLSTRQHGEIAVNATLRTALTMPAVDRYTGVLYDALVAASLDAPARRWLGRHAMIHSAPLGPIGALDPIPAYRLAAGTALPGLAPLRRVWADAVTTALAQAQPPFILDLRSEAYAVLGPVPVDTASAYVRVIAEGEDGTVRALNHFNKRAKGLLVRRLATERPRIASRAGFVRWAVASGIRVRDGAPGELNLVAD